MIEFKLLGDLEVVINGAVADITAPRQRAVLAVLLLAPNRVVPLDQLVDKIYRGEPPAQATSSVQAYVSHLRRLFEPQRPPRAPSQVLTTKPPGYLLVVDPVRYDVARFETGVESGAALLAAGDANAALRDLDAALAEWRGNALAEFVDEPFAQLEIARLEELRVAAIEARVNARLAIGETHMVLPELERMVREFPTREGLWAALVVALYRAGRQGDALRAYQRCRAVLGEELGIEPGPALRQLERDVLDNAPALEWRAPAELPPRAVRAQEEAPAEIASNPAAPGVALVGRTAELSVVHRALDDAHKGTTRVILVAGQAGMGKSRLAEQAASDATDRGFLVAVGRNHEGAGAPAFWPWVQILRSVADAVPPDVFRDACTVGAPELVRLVPELAAVLGEAQDPAPEADAAAAQFRLYDAVAQTLLRLSRSAPMVIVVEDLHFADASTLRLVDFVASHLDRACLLLVGTYRPDDGSAPLNELLANAAGRAGVARIELRGLDADQTRRLVESVVDLPIEADTASVIHRRSEGNPFFAGELSRLLISEGAVGTRLIEHAVPGTVRDVLMRRLARLPESTNALLVIAAAMGRDLDLDTLRDVSGLQEDELLDQVEPALLVGVVVEAASGHYRFAHVLIRDCVYATLSPARRARLHARIAAAVEARHGADARYVAEIAHHYAAAAPAVAPEKAIDRCEQAAIAAAAALALEDAEDWLRKAIELTSLLDADDAALRELRLLNRLAGLMTMTVGYGSPAIAAAWRRAHELSERIGGSADRVQALWGRHSFAIQALDFEAARLVGDEMDALADESGDPICILSARHGRGALAVHCVDLIAARDALLSALPLADALDSAMVESLLGTASAVVCRSYLGIALWLLGDPDGAQRVFEEVTDLVSARECGVFTQAVAWLADALYRLCIDEPEAAGIAGQHALEVAQSVGFAQLASIADIVTGWSRARSGDKAAAERMAEALGDLKASGWGVWVPALATMVADAFAAADDFPRAFETVEAALADAARTGDRTFDAELRRRHAELRLVRWPEQRDTAKAELEEALAIAGGQLAGGWIARIEASLLRVDRLPD